MTKQIDLQTIIPFELAGRRLDQALSQLFPEHSRSRLQQWLRDQQIKVDGRYLRARDKVSGGENVIIQASVTEQVVSQPQAIELDVLYQDEHLLIINKPAGLVVHPGAGNPNNTLQNALLYLAPELVNVPRAGIIHRLDKDTSGILVIARTLAAHTQLVQQLQAREIQRDYLALVHGKVISGGTIDAPLGRHSLLRTQMTIREDGKPAVTHYRVAERFRSHTLLNVQLETGRTHQIRVHLTSVGYPLVGDKVYGGRFKVPKAASEELLTVLRQLKRQALHAARLQLRHPHTDKMLDYSAPLPDDLQNLLAALRKDLHNK